jgi:choline dehydrogenase-like flavoprotein
LVSGIGVAAARDGWGPLDPGPLDAAVEAGAHHMGATRMHDSPEHGVVDADCRVHGTTNLYVAGPSVFPTYGYANPMLTVVALALRLADHLIGAA